MQGVAFRYSTQQRAEDLALSGWVRNLRDGRVEVEVEGDAGSVAAMLQWLERGPPTAVVRDVLVTELEPLGKVGFEILHTA